jgi:phage terminase Nu1 subunit (DNA packaging protein)
MGELLKIQEYADRVGVKRPYIYKLAKQEKIHFVIGEDGKKRVDTSEADPILKFREAGREVPRRPQNNNKKTTSAISKQNESELPELKKSAKYSELDKIKLYEQARKLRLENDIKEKKLIDAGEAKNLFFETARNIRNALEAIPPRITPVIVGMGAHDMEQELKKEVNRVLMSLSEEILNL